MKNFWTPHLECNFCQMYFNSNIFHPAKNYSRERQNAKQESKSKSAIFHTFGSSFASNVNHKNRNPYFFPQCTRFNLEIAGMCPQSIRYEG
jgi:hypothetical protein